MALRSRAWQGALATALLLAQLPWHSTIAAQRQSPSTALTRASAATAAVSARITRGPSEIGTTKGCLRRSARSSGSKPPSGPISTASGRGCSAASAAKGEADRRRLVGKDQEPRRVPCFEHWRRASRGAHLRHAQNPALLGGLDGIGEKPVGVDALGHRAPRDHRLQQTCPHLGRLLRHIVEAGAFQRREEIVQIRAFVLRPRLLATTRFAFFLAMALTAPRHSPSSPLKRRTSSPVLHRSTLMR